MTKFKWFIPVTFLVFSVFASCDKAEKINEEVSESDALEIVEANLQVSAGGLLSNLEDTAEQLLAAVASGELCDTLYAETIDEEYQGDRFQCTYTSDLSYEMVCNSLDVPQSASFSIETSTMYSSTRIESTDNGDFGGSVTGLQPSSTTFTIAGEYSRTGNQDLNFKSQKSITSTLAFDLASITMNKQSLEIQSGSGTFLLSGSAQDQGFSFAGTIVFNGGNTATLTIDGTTYQIDWN